MTAHDLLALTPTISGYTASCRCGWEGHDTTQNAARDLWDRHIQLVRVSEARTALEGEPDEPDDS